MEVSIDLPLNVASTSDEEIGRDMSNFADFPFYYGRKPIRYWNVESFYQALTHSDEKIRRTIAKMPAANRRARLNAPRRFSMGRRTCLGPAEHHELIKSRTRSERSSISIPSLPAGSGYGSTPTTP